MFITFSLAYAAAAGVPSSVLTTNESISSFGSCFTGNQDNSMRAWSFVPNEAGGNFTNRGAAGVAEGYRLAFREGASNKIILSGSAEDLSRIAAAVRACS